MDAKVLIGTIKQPEPVKAFVGDDGIYIPSRYDMRFHELLISRELFVEAYNKWIKNKYSCLENPFFGEDDADDWCD